MESHKSHVPNHQSVLSGMNSRMNGMVNGVYESSDIPQELESLRAVWLESHPDVRYAVTISIIFAEWV